MGMNFNIREAVLLKAPKTEEGIREMIDDAIKEGEEVTLPGLGVLFEVLWQESSSSEQQNILEKLKKKVLPAT